MQKEVYIYIGKNMKISKYDVTIGDIANLWSDDKTLKSKISTLKIYDFEGKNETRIIISALSLVKKIQEQEPDLILVTGDLLNLSEENILTQKRVVIEEFKQRCLNVPYGDMFHLMSALAYQVHPYRWPTIGLSTEDIENASHQEITHFFHRHYAVNNLILCVSGHVSFEQAVSLCEKWFGDFQSVDLPPRNLPQEPAQTEPRFQRVRRKVPHNTISIMYHMCGRRHADYQACDMISDILSNGKSSRFFRNVMMKQNLFTELDASISGTVDPGLLLVKAQLADGVPFTKAQKAIDDEISDFLRTGTTAYEMEKCANKFESTQLFSNITYQKKAVKLCEYELLHQAADINLEVQKYRNLSVDSLMNVAQKLFNPNNRSILFYGPDA